MRLTPRIRQIVLGTTLAATLSAVAWQYAQPQSEPADGVVAPVKNKTTQKSFTQSTPHLALDKLQRADDVQVDRIKDAFQAQSWAPPPPPPAPPAPPPPPSPPPLPFTYMGQLVEDGTLTVFLSRQDQNYAVKAGDSLDGTYRVDKVENRRLVLTYLPLNMQQSLAIGSVN